MTPENISKAIRLLKMKNCEGFGRIPVRYLIDGITQITPVLSHLFNLIYKTKQIPDQWRIIKVIPILKKAIQTKLKTIGQFQTSVRPQKYLKNSS